jgi:hypothetical protein
LKQVIDASKAEPGKSISPGRLTIALGPILETVAALADDESAQQIAMMLSQTMAQSPGKDHVKIESRSIPNGSMTRITLEEGVLRLIGTAAMLGQQMMAPGGPMPGPGGPPPGPDPF